MDGPCTLKPGACAASCQLLPLPSTGKHTATPSQAHHLSTMTFSASGVRKAGALGPMRICRRGAGMESVHTLISLQALNPWFQGRQLALRPTVSLHHLSRLFSGTHPKPCTHPTHSRSSRPGAAASAG